MVIWQNNGGGSTCKCHIINSDGMDHIHSHCMVLNKYGITVMINDKKSKKTFDGNIQCIGVTLSKLKRICSILPKLDMHPQPDCGPGLKGLQKWCVERKGGCGGSLMLALS